MAETNLIHASDRAAWIAALQRCGNYDVYHTPEYHLLAEEMGEGRPYLFSFDTDEGCAALPFLLRPVSEVQGLENSTDYDITSVYGYAGAVTSLHPEHERAEEFLKLFHKELLRLFKKLSVVAFFTRANPLLQNTWLLKDFAEVRSLSCTVAIDLSLPNDLQLAAMSKGHRYDIRKAHSLGVVVEEDSSFERIDDFIPVYNDTMKRNGASAGYYFPKEYYLNLKKHLGAAVTLYFAMHEGRIVSASIFFRAGSIIQYHLSGTPAQFFRFNGAKIILDEVRQYGSRNGFSWLHLGGGVGASKDSLYQFKAGFSDVRLPFDIVLMVIDEQRYAELYASRSRWAQDFDYSFSDTSFFPAYRQIVDIS